MNRRLIEAAIALADALERENAALVACDLAGAAALLERKQVAVAAFEAAQAQPAQPAHPAHPAGPDEDRQSLAAQLRALAEDNRRLLERAIRVQGRVVGIVARAVAPKPAAPRYGAGGTLRGGTVVPVVVSARV